MDFNLPPPPQSVFFFIFCLLDSFTLVLSRDSLLMLQEEGVYVLDVKEVVGDGVLPDKHFPFWLPSKVTSKNKRGGAKSMT